MTTPAVTRRDRRAEQRERAREEQRRRREHPSQPPFRSPLVLTTIGALVVGLVLVVGLFIINRPGGSGAIIAAGGPPAPAALIHGRSVGDPAAPVTIEVWSDFQCPVCDRLATQIEPLLRTTFIPDGTVRLVYRDFAFLGRESTDAAIAARAAEGLNGSFWAYHDLLFANQGARENGGAFSRDRLADIAVAAGLDRAAFSAAMDDPEYTSAVIAETAQGNSLGIQSTPTLLINGAMYSGIPQWSELTSMIEAAKTNATGASPSP